MDGTFYKRKHGFTLIELMIVVAIIAVLAAVAIPAFTKLQAKSKQSEAKILMTGIFDAELVYFSEKSRYTDNPTTLNFKPASVPKYYTNWDTNIVARENSFTATVSGNVDKDAESDVWMITDRHRGPFNTYDDVDDASYVYPY